MTLFMHPPMVRLSSLLLGAVLLFGAPASAAQPAQPESLSASARISLITGLPGDQIHTEFGHSALRVWDPVQGFDWLYNYGTFNFRDPYFVPKFTYGRLNYFLSISTYGGTVDVYYRQGRPIIEQRLRLTRSQRAKLWAFLRHNAQEEHRTYRYNFLFDNCSTRIRDAFKSALGDDVQFADTPDPDRSFRQMLDPYVADRPLLDVGFDLGLGVPADADVSASEAMFLPEYLLAAFNHAQIRVGTEMRPLVTRTDTVTWIEGYDATERAFPWPTALAWGLFLLGAAWTGWQAWTGQTPGRWVDAGLLGASGVASLLMLFLWFVSEHTVTNYNWNLLWAWPTHLVAAVVLVRSGSSALRPGLQRYFLATSAVALLLAGGWTWVPQNLHAALLPVVLGLALRPAWQVVARRSRVQQAPPSTTEPAPTS